MPPELLQKNRAVLPPSNTAQKCLGLTTEVYLQPRQHRDQMPKFTQPPVKRPAFRSALVASSFAPTSGRPLDKLARQVTSSTVSGPVSDEESAFRLTPGACSDENFGKRVIRVG